jgi:hypothetical protein
LALKLVIRLATRRFAPCRCHISDFKPRRRPVAMVGGVGPVRLCRPSAASLRLRKDQKPTATQNAAVKRSMHLVVDKRQSLAGALVNNGNQKDFVAVGTWRK